MHERAMVDARHALAIDGQRDRARPLVEHHVDASGQRIAIFAGRRIVDLGEHRQGVEQHQFADHGADGSDLNRRGLHRQPLGIDNQKALLPVGCGLVQQ